MNYFLGNDLDKFTLTKEILDSLKLHLDPPYYVGPVKLILPPIFNKFHSILAIDETNTIINNSNSFLSDPNFVNHDYQTIQNYDNVYSIYIRIKLTYDYLCNNKEDIVIDNEMFLLCNPFSATNIGHDLSILFHRINTYRERGLTIPVVLSEFMLTIPRSLEVCKLLLPNTEFYMLPNNKIVKFTKLHIASNLVFDIKKHNNIIEEVLEKSIQSPTIQNIDDYKNKKILLIKTTKNKNVITSSTCFNCDKTIELLTSKYDYVYINPEEMSMIEIILYVHFAKKIVCSYGAILYAHAIFFNPHIKYIYLEQLHNVPLYFLKREQYTSIRISNELDKNIPELLSQLGEEPLPDI
jgi:hypothetical protein